MRPCGELNIVSLHFVAGEAVAIESPTQAPGARSIALRVLPVASIWLLLALLEWATGIDVALRSLFVLPTAIAAWSFGRVGGFACALVSAALVGFLDWQTGLFALHSAFIVSDGFSRLISFSTVAELTVRVRDTRALAVAQANRLDSLIAMATEAAIVGCDHAGVITTFNTGAEKIFGRSAEKMLGQPLSELWPETARGALAALWPGDLATADLFSPRAQDLPLTRPDGTRAVVRVIGGARVASGGAPVGHTLVAIDVTNEVAATAALQTRNEDLKAFAYTVSHDLRAPLRGIAGYASELERTHRAALGERGLFCLAQIRSSAHHLDRLVEDLLGYARLGEESASACDVELEPVLGRLLLELKPTIDEAGAAVELDLAVKQLRVWERGLTQVLHNLLENALKFSVHSQPPRVKVASRRAADGAIQISVADNGIGFEQKNAERVFGLFARLDQARGYAGTGAGLAIARRAAEKLGGSLRAESAPDAGATFTLDLPGVPAPGGGGP